MPAWPALMRLLLRLRALVAPPAPIRQAQAPRAVLAVVRELLHFLERVAVQAALWELTNQGQAPRVARLASPALFQLPLDLLSR